MINEIKRRIKRLEKEIRDLKRGKYAKLIGRRNGKDVVVRFKLKPRNENTEGKLEAYKELLRFTQKDTNVKGDKR